MTPEQVGVRADETLGFGAAQRTGEETTVDGRVATCRARDVLERAAEVAALVAAQQHIPGAAKK